MASIIKADTLQSTTANVSILNSSGTEYARFDSTGNFQLANPTTFPAGTAALPAITTTGDTNTGIFFSAADTIDFAEGGTATGQFDSSGNFKFNSGYGSVATAYGCRAWVNFDGTGTVAIRASGNVTSITDNGTGNYTINFTIAMPDANYSGVFGCNDNGNTTNMNYRSSGTKSTTAFQVSTVVTAATLADNNMCMVAIFR